MIYLNKSYAYGGSVITKKLTDDLNSLVVEDELIVENFDKLEKASLMMDYSNSSMVRRKVCCHNVLIMDDDKLNLQALKSVIKGYNFKIYTGHDGVEGLRIFNDFLNSPESCKTCFNFRFILTDLNMPNMDGPTCIEEIMKTIRLNGSKRIEPRRIIITAFDDDRSQNYCLDKGVEFIKNKPVKKAILLALQDELNLL